MNKLILLLLVSIFLGGCAGCYTDSPYDNCLGSWHLEPGTEEYIEWEKREKKRELREAKELKAKQDADDKIPIYKMCMMWDDAYNGSRSAIKTRERIAQSLERRGQDPLYCRNTSNSNDAARRAEDAAKAAERRARAAEDAAYAAQQEAYENRRRQDDYEYNQQNQQYDPPDFTPGTWD